MKLYREIHLTYQSFRQGKYSPHATLDVKSHWKLTENDIQEGYSGSTPDVKWLAVEVFDMNKTPFHIVVTNWKTKIISILTDARYAHQPAPVFVDGM